MFTRGGVRAVGILTQGTRSSGAVFRRVASGGYSSGDVRAEGILTLGTRSSGAVFRRDVRAVGYFVRAALTVCATFSK